MILYHSIQGGLLNRGLPSTFRTIWTINFEPCSISYYNPYNMEVPKTQAALNMDPKAMGLVVRTPTKTDSQFIETATWYMDLVGPCEGHVVFQEPCASSHIPYPAKIPNMVNMDPLSPFKLRPLLREPRHFAEGPRAPLHLVLCFRGACGEGHPERPVRLGRVGVGAQRESLR